MPTDDDIEAICQERLRQPGRYDGPGERGDGLVWSELHRLLVRPQKLAQPLRRSVNPISGGGRLNGWRLAAKRRMGPFVIVVPDPSFR